MNKSIEQTENKTKNLIEKAEKKLLFTTVRPDIIMEKGKGMYLWDTEGKCYLDFIGGWAVTCLGHCPEVIAEALQQQSNKLINASPSFYNEPMIKLADLLVEHSCFDRVFFTSTGAEANEGAIKLARKYGQKFKNGAYEIITTINSFHGRTLAAMAATGKEAWETLFQPKMPGFKHVPFNDIDSIKASVSDNTVAIMIELIQGEGGVIPAEESYVKALRELCDENNILLIFDEVQTGIGRTGTLFAYEQYGIEPDIMTLAKGIGGGFPLSAMLTKEKFNIFDIGDQGGTYCGQPLAMAAGYAVVNEVINKSLDKNAKTAGEYIIKELEKIKDKYGLKNIRGRGLLIGFDLPQGKGKELVNHCLEKGLIINSPRPSIIRLMPSLICSCEDIKKMIGILSESLSALLI